MSTRVCACLLSCLKTICVRRFKGRPDGLDAATYLLKHGKILNKAKIYTRDLSKKLVMKLGGKFQGCREFKELYN